MANWQQFDRREQKILLSGGLIVALILLWWLLIQPLRAMVDNQQDVNTRLGGQLQQAHDLAAELKTLKASGKTTVDSNSLMRLVSNSARSHGLGMSNFTPNSDNSVSLRFEQVAFNNFVQWLNQMESNHQAVIDNLSITPTGDSGVVKVSVRLRGSG
ncbi:MAG: type II secretion system protein M [Porticoccaceae bacterium]|nr:type II secretion system protein M [Porticoccaceae bacterium]